jgi:hypothetical protein
MPAYLRKAIAARQDKSVEIVAAARALTQLATRLQPAKRNSSNAFCGRTTASRKHRGVQPGTDIVCNARANKISVLIEKAAERRPSAPKPRWTDKPRIHLR